MAELKDPKQERFCQLFIELGNASEAYRQAFHAENMADSTIWVKACELKKTDKVTVRINEIQSQHRERHNMTVDDLIKELEEARQAGLEFESASAMVAATMGKAKLLGLDKQLIDVTTNGQSINKPSLDVSKLSDEQLRNLDTIISQASETGTVETKSE